MSVLGVGYWWASTTGSSNHHVRAAALCRYIEEQPHLFKFIYYLFHLFIKVTNMQVLLLVCVKCKNFEELYRVITFTHC